MHAQIYLQVMDKSDFLIPLNGLPQGRSLSRTFVDRKFFESFENAEILDASLDISIETEKSGQYIGIDCRMSGNVTVACDRCLEPLVIPVDTVARLSVKFGSGTADEADMTDSGREIVRVPSDEAELDMAQVIYDYVCLSLPMRRTHPDGECNESVMKYLEHENVSAGNRKDSSNPFAVLEGLFGS